jgi:hypothetical protein
VAGRHTLSGEDAAAVPMPDIAERTGLPLELVEYLLYGPDEKVRRVGSR